MRSPGAVNIKPFCYFKFFSLATLHPEDGDFIFVAQISLLRSPILVQRAGVVGEHGKAWGLLSLPLCDLQG